MGLIRVKLTEAHKFWKPTLFPGSAEARQKGCTCPTTQPWPGGFTFTDGCPVHPLEVASVAPAS
jgi:hypothetical protein